MKSRPSFRIIFSFLALILFGVGQTFAANTIPLSERVLVVYNANIPESLEVANYYLAKHSIPAKNLCAITPIKADAIDWYNYEINVKKPIQSCLNALGKDRILYIVFAYQTPFRLLNVPTESGYELRALDQFIADIWNDQVPDITEISNHAYYAANQSQGNFYLPFQSLADYRNQSAAQPLYSVWRLDAATADSAKGLVDKALQTEANGLRGQGCFDRRFGNVNALEDWNYGAGDWDLFRAAEITRKVGLAVTEDENEAEFGTAPAPLRCENVALYAGWYTYNHYNDAFSWVPGAIGFHLDSGSAIDPRSGVNWSANALQRGLTITSGAVNEPYLEGLPHADGVVRNLFEGANVGDAFLRNTAFLQWMVINLGDPLYRPFPNGLPPFNSPSYTESSLALEPTYVVGGETATGTFTLEAPAPIGGTEVTLSNTRTEAATLPEKLLLPAGATKASFTITTATTTYYQAPVITATFDGKTLSNTLGLAPLLAAITFSRPVVASGAATKGTILLNGLAPSGGVRIVLSSDTPSVVPSDNILIPAGKAKANFTVTPKLVAGNTNVVVSALFNGSKETATLTVVPTRRRVVTNRRTK